jgi:hypothetical protein
VAGPHARRDLRVKEPATWSRPHEDELVTGSPDVRIDCLTIDCDDPERLAAVCCAPPSDGPSRHGARGAGSPP